MRRYVSHSEAETGDVAREIASRLAPGAVVAFTGGLGAGKTAFVRGAIKAFGNGSFVSSPTFALVNDYGGQPHVYHFDMYRVLDEDDLYSTGFFDYLDGESVLFVEWSENITDSLPENTVFVDIARGDADTERIITVWGGDF